MGQNPTVAEQKGPEKFMIPVSDRVEYPWNKNDTSGKAFIQGILNAKCVQCHNQSTNGNKAQEFYTITVNSVTSGTATYQIPRFDMSDRPITVTYDNKVQTLNASYVSIFYPAALEMVMGQMTIQGTVPPKWGVPADARGSEMIHYMNVKASDGTTAWPVTDKPMHPENVGVTLTDEERQALIRSFDMGGQYYARQNTSFAPYAGVDPVAPKK
jgi:hypothetical protein